MRQFLLFFILFLLSINFEIFSQGVGINEDGSDPDESAILDIKSTTKGVVLPRMTNQERDLIASPVAGLMIFNTDINSLQLFDGYAWLNLSVSSCAPEAPDIISGNEYPECGQTGVSYTISPVQNATAYNWEVPFDANITNGQGTTDITVNFGSNSGNVSVQSTSGCGSSIYTQLAISINIPGVPGPISGNSNPDCNSSGNTYSVSPVNGATNYNWTVPADATISNGQGTTSILVDFGTQDGNVSVRAENSCGNTDYTDYPVSTGIIDDIGNITGNDFVDCNASGETYSVNPVNNATNYNWTVPGDASIISGQGTTSITIDFGTQSGDVSVRAENSCDISNYSVLNVSTIPEAPGSISGETDLCTNESGVSYTIDPVLYANSYHWIVPADAVITSGQGTTSIAVDFGTQSGNVSVRAENSCGNSIYTDLAVNPGIHIGCVYAGGIVFYIDGTGEHGLVCAENDQSVNAEWGCDGTEITGADATEIGTGSQNTVDILNDCSQTNIAAEICDDLSFNGYDDWFLPSIQELYEMLTELRGIGLGNFAADSYWSSSELNEFDALYITFVSGSANPGIKGSDYRVRAVRAF